MKHNKVKFTRITLFIFIILTVASNIFPQGTLYRVIAASKNITAGKINSNIWKPVCTGDILSIDDILKLQSEGYIGLISSNGRSFEINNAGIYKLSDLVNTKHKLSPGLQKIADQIITESIKNNKKSENIKSEGSVVSSGVGVIENYAPLTSRLLDTYLHPAWYSAGNGTNYTFKLIDDGNKPVCRVETKDTTVSIDLNKFELEKDKNYYWVIYNSSNPDVKTDTCSFSLLSDAAWKITTDSLENIRHDLDVNSAVDNYLFIKCLESFGLNYDALAGYENLIKLYPDIDEYRNSFLMFLLKQNVTKKAELLLSSMKNLN